MFSKNRRRFAQAVACAGIGSTSILSTLTNLQLARAAATQSASNTGDEYKALVCIFLYGGNDSFNMLIPADKNEYGEYATSRGSLALPLDETAKYSALALNGKDNIGRSYAIHPAMNEIKALFENESLAFISNIGALVEPTTVESFRSGSAS